MVTGREDVVGLDSRVILPRQVWVASGHVDVFTDPLVECTNCHRRFRADQLAEEFAERTGGPSLEPSTPRAVATTSRRARARTAARAASTPRRASST